eukprot:10452068-Alexandrium_andersonii.AAC.1
MRKPVQQLLPVHGVQGEALGAQPEARPRCFHTGIRQPGPQGWPPDTDLEAPKSCLWLSTERLHPQLIGTLTQMMKGVTCVLLGPFFENCSATAGAKVGELSGSGLRT